MRIRTDGDWHSLQDGPAVGEIGFRSMTACSPVKLSNADYPDFAHPNRLVTKGENTMVRVVWPTGDSTRRFAVVSCRSSGNLGYRTSRFCVWFGHGCERPDSGDGAEQTNDEL
jgi:hypothetical protein